MATKPPTSNSSDSEVINYYQCHIYYHWNGLEWGYFSAEIGDGGLAAGSYSPKSSGTTWRSIFRGISPSFRNDSTGSTGKRVNHFTTTHDRSTGNRKTQHHGVRWKSFQEPMWKAVRTAVFRATISLGGFPMANCGWFNRGRTSSCVFHSYSMKYHH